MAKIRSGILGNIRGKVAGVVGSQWKDVNYLREFVKPANPNTAAQQLQRGKMSDIVAFCKTLVGPIFNAYTDKFQKSMSGFNYFIKQSIAEFDGSPVWANLKLTEGKLHPPGTFLANYDSVTGVVEMTWDATEGNNGAASDKIFGAVYDTNAELWNIFAVEDERNGTPHVRNLATGLTETDIECWIFAIQYQGTIVSLISNSVHAQCTAA